MVNIIVELSKYVIIVLMAAYTFSCFSIFTRNYEDEEKKVLIRQDVLMFLLQFAAFGTMYLVTKDIRIIFLYAVLAVILLAVILLYNLIYPNVSRLVVNNMCMLITVGMIMITRLSSDNPSPYGTAVRQLIFAALGIAFGLVVPVLIRKMKFLDQWTYIYAAVGGAALLAVALFAQMSGGAKLGFEIAGINIQPSEFVKIIFVFFVAASLNKSKEFKNIVITTAIAAAHVLILVLSTDLGAALILFVVYLVMLFVATRQWLYAVAGLGAGAAAAVVGYHLFAHIQVRVEAWQDPIGTYSGSGYQVAQSLFAIGTGSWFGTGLFKGQPDTIPVAETDFIFSAITEEMGVIYALCLILICVSCYVMFLNIAMELRNIRYRIRSVRCTRMAGGIYTDTIPLRQIRPDHFAGIPVRRDGTYGSDLIYGRADVPEREPDIERASGTQFLDCARDFAYVVRGLRDDGNGSMMSGQKRSLPIITPPR